MAKRLGWALVLALVVFLGTGAVPARAHAVVVRTEPADGAVLVAPPPQIRLWFSEPIALNLTTLDLVDANGRHIPIKGLRGDAAALAVAVRSEGAGAAEVAIDLPSLLPSVYRLSWRTLSNTDLHNTSGLIVFGVQRDTAGASASVAEALPSSLEIGLRWLNLGALAGAFGALALALLGLPWASRRNEVPIAALEYVAIVRRRLLVLAGWSGIAGLLAGLALLLAQALAVADADLARGLATAWEIMIGTRYGLAWIAREGALGLLVACIMLYRQRITRPTARPFSSLYTRLFGLLALAVAGAQAAQSHAAANDLAFVRLIVDTAHVLAASIWMGGLLALVLVVAPLLRADRDAMALAWALLRSFGALAAGSLAVLVVSGLLLVGEQVASIDALLTTLYGWVLAAKLVLVGGLALLGLLNAARLHGWVADMLGHLLRRPAGWVPFGPTRLVGILRLELAGGVLVLGLVAVLSAAQPARGPAFEPAPGAQTLSSSSRAGDLLVTLALKPNRPGQNFLTLGVFDTRRPAPAPIAQVRVQLEAQGSQAVPPPVVATALGGGRYEISDGSISHPGAWNVIVVVQRAGLPDATTTFPWTVLAPARPVVISASPLMPWMAAAALVVMLLLTALFSTWRLRRGLAQARVALAQGPNIPEY